MGNKKSKTYLDSNYGTELKADCDIVLQDGDHSSLHLERQLALQRAYQNNDLLTIIILESYLLKSS